MKVRAVKSFGGSTADGRYHVSAGDEFELPAGVDWLRAGLVVPVETAAVAGGKPRETAPGNEPVTAISGIGPKTAADLRKLGVETVADLAAAEVPDVYADFQAAARRKLTGG